MQKIILIISAFTCILIIYLLLKKDTVVPNYSSKLDSLQTEINNINSKRDSIRLQIDTTVIKIKENEKYYKETVNNIITNNVDDNYIFFIEYLEYNKNRLDSIYNCESIERN